MKEFIEQAVRLTMAAKSLALRAKYETMLRESFIYDMFISDINSKGIDCACYNRRVIVTGKQIGRAHV